MRGEDRSDRAVGVRSLGETIEIETVRSPNLWRVEVDSNALENAIHELIQALHAGDRDDYAQIFEEHDSELLE